MPFLSHPTLLNFIRTIPVAEHCVTVRADAWADLCRETGTQAVHDAFFTNWSEVQIMRSSLRSAEMPNELRAFGILLWGYPKGVRGHERHWLEHLPAIARAAAAETSDWPTYLASFEEIPRIGMSTVTKLAYFFGRCFRVPDDAEPVSALILDSRILNALQAAHWSELTHLRHLNYGNAAVHYPTYLSTLHRLARKNGFTPDQLEFFLFAHGMDF
jgi:hypothetical protein